MGGELPVTVRRERGAVIAEVTGDSATAAPAITGPGAPGESNNLPRSACAHINQIRPHMLGLFSLPALMQARGLTILVSGAPDRDSNAGPTA
jgi:hypothetical protein